MSACQSYTSRRSAVIGLRGGASTDQPLATAAAIEVLQKGGNAADAAVAAAAALQVLQPYATGVGGDCFCLFYEGSSKSVRCIDGSGRSPAKLTLDLLKSRGYMDNKTVPGDSSGLAATVPGAVKGWFDTLHHFGSGKVTMADVLRPAIRYAEDGFPVGHANSFQWKACEKKLETMHGGRAFLRAGRAPNAGDVLTNVALADVLKRLAVDGPSAFYKGPVARAVVDAVCASGGVMTVDDLENHLNSSESPVLTPISTTYHNVMVHTMPPPSHGAILLEALNILEGFDLQGMSSSEYHHLLIEALRLAFADGLLCISSPCQGARATLAKMCSKSHARERSGLIHMHQAIEKIVAGDIEAPKQSHTVFLTTADEQGNACAFINSNFLGFGCTIVEDHGFAVHCRGMGFTATEGHLNCIGPLKKPYHTLMPVIVTDAKSGLWKAAMGTMGGYGQPQINLQVLLGMLEHGLDPQEAVDRPRFNIGAGYSVHPDDALIVEEGVPADVVEALEKMGHRIKATLRGFERRSAGHAHVVTRGSWWKKDNKDTSHEGDVDVLWFGCDPRCDGTAMVY